MSELVFKSGQGCASMPEYIRFFLCSSNCIGRSFLNRGGHVSKMAGIDRLSATLWEKIHVTIKPFTSKRSARSSSRTQVTMGGMTLKKRRAQGKCLCTSMRAGVDAYGQMMIAFLTRIKEPTICCPEYMQSSMPTKTVSLVTSD